MSKVGKKVLDELYIHLSAVDHLGDAEQRIRIKEAHQSVLSLSNHAPNVAKLSLRTGRLSLLAYAAFDDDPFPALAASWIFAPGETAPRSFRTYVDSLNPPILHRKELLVPPGYPGREQWSLLTTIAENLGLFDEPSTVGFKLNWERMIANKGYRFAGDELVPIGNEIDPTSAEPESTDAPIQRHLTALTRNNLSAPVQLLFRHGLLPPGTSVFDYGCGKGSDVAGLVASGLVAHGWDPHFAANEPIFNADIVNLGFVINVIEDPAERVEALTKAFKLARRALAISVMLYGSEPAGRPFRDGFVTSRQTFQKYFAQAEFKDYVEQVLEQEAFMAGPGVAIVFADKECEQRFHTGRFRRRGIAARLLETRAPRVRQPNALSGIVEKVPKSSRAQTELAAARPLLDQLWTTVLDLGRLPDPSEVGNLGALNSELGGLGKAARLLSRHYDQSLLAAAASTRTEDLQLYFTAQQFRRRPPYRQLESRLQSDIKAFFGDYRSAQAAGLRLLVDAANPSRVFEACELASTRGLGWLEGQHSLQLHVSLVDRLPALLRAYVSCGLMLWNGLSEVQLIKIHIASGKLSLMEFDNFDSSPVPLLSRRIKVNIRRQTYDLFEYGSPEYPKPLLYRKSRYLHEDYPCYAEQLAFDEALDETGILTDSDFGPPAERLAEMLETRRLAMIGMRLVRSERIPHLSQPCGRNFTFRSFIECGETQLQLGLKNLPKNFATYNAMYDLATRVLDPLIDYFGGIRLTYGFCSAELGRHITRGVAPKLDQHASYELTAKGSQICDRGGAACDFLVEDEDMREVSDWILANLTFDRMYFYGSSRPIHVSYAPNPTGQCFDMREGPSGRLIPRRYTVRAP